MRILMTTDTVGGVWRFTQELVAGLLAEGCEITLISLGASPTHAQSSWAGQTSVQCEGRFHYTATDLPLEWMQSNQAAYEEAAELILQCASNLQADVIHSNQFCFGALTTSIPRVVTAHSDVVSWAESCQAQALEPSEWLDRYRALVSIGLSGAQAVVAPTSWMLDSLSRTFALTSATHVIPNGSSISPAPSAGRKLKAITAGRLWDPAKNIAILGDLLSPVPLLTAGDSLHETATAPYLSKVHSLGLLPEEALLSLFRESAMYICTSKYEPFGLAPLEAALCGCAILANDIPSLREVWQDAALYFSDAASLDLLLYELSSSPALLAAAQMRSLQRAEKYTRQRMTASYLALFQQAVTESLGRDMANVA